MKEKKDNQFIMMGYTPSKYEIFEPRLKKPISIVRPDDPPVDFALVFQEADKIKLHSKKNLEFFVPNNIALLISTSSKSLDDAKDIYKNKLNQDNPKNGYKKDEVQVDFMKRKSSSFCDYIEKIQTGIVFSYTAIEAFANISIPDNYHYIIKNKKGVIYDKFAIERWVSLREKLEFILTEIYKTESIKSDSNWNNFLKLESLKNNIIHQKSDNHSDFFKEYFKDDIYGICKSTEGIIRFFYDKHNKENRTNPLWPWLIGKEKDFPIKVDSWDNWEPVEKKDK